MAKTKHTSSSSFQPQPSQAEKAFLSLQSEFEAFTGPLQRPMIDIQAAAAIGHSVAIRDQQLARLTLFERLADSDLYDLRLLERVGQLALAAWFIRQRQANVLALSSDANVPLEVVRDAQQQRRTMLKVLDHWFDDDPEIAAEVAVIREGMGHQDLANDLEALADVYQRPAIRLVVREDRKHYRDTDVKTARKLARSIFGCLGLARESDTKRWSTLCQRSWALLVRDYDEHRAAGMFLFRKLEDVTESYPSLVSAVRRPPSPRPIDDEGSSDLDELEDDEVPATDAPLGAIAS